ncbi:MAG: ABC transporter permease [Acidimicrobiia bacterium]
MRALVAQTRTELVLTLRRGESLLLVFGIPLLLLAFFSVVDVLPVGDAAEPVDFLAPGILALAVMSTGMVQLAIGTGFERQYGVLKRLGATPLGRPRLLAAKTLAIAAVEAVQVLLVVVLALLLGWSPVAEAGAVVGLVVLGTVAFAGIGLLMAGTLRGEVTLAAANGLYLVLLLTGGMVFSVSELPAAVRVVAELLPAAALADGLAGTLSGTDWHPARDWAVLGAWAVVGPALAARYFRWE